MSEYGRSIMVSVSFDTACFQNGVARSRWNFLRTVEIYANQARMASLVVVADGALLLYETKAVRFQDAHHFAELHAARGYAAVAGE